MPGAMRKMGVYLGLVEDDDRHDEPAEYSSRASSRARDYDRGHRDDDYDSADDAVEYDDDYDEPAAPAPVRSIAPERERVAPRSSARWSGSDNSDAGYRITTLHPRTYPEARTIGEQLREGTPVIINLSEMDDADAKRLVDFAAGLTFGLRGSIERVTNKVFLLSPQKVTVSAEDRARIAEGGYAAAR